MPPSADELVLKLLSQSVARLEGDGRKRKQEEDDVTFLESVKKVRKNVPEAATNTDMTKSLIVYHYLKEVSPKLAEELSVLHTFPLVSCHLKEISPEVFKNLSPFPNISKKSDTGKPANKTTGHKSKRFTPKEDDVLKAAIEEAGEDPINVSSLAKRLNRPGSSVSTRIELIKRNGGILKQMKFTLVEDILVLDRLIIPRVEKEQLSKVFLSKHHYTELTRELGKSKTAVLRRWGSVLQPWLLQHYSGTLNLRVERMLANYICDTFTDFSSIDWPEVSARSEFAGHTEQSLRRMYFSHLCRGAMSKLGLSRDEVTPMRIAEYCELVGVFGKGGDRESSKRMQRQRDVISYFERKVMELGLKSFV